MIQPNETVKKFNLKQNKRFWLTLVGGLLIMLFAITPLVEKAVNSFAAQPGSDGPALTDADMLHMAQTDHRSLANIDLKFRYAGHIVTIHTRTIGNKRQIHTEDIVLSSKIAFAGHTTMSKTVTDIADGTVDLSTQTFTGQMKMPDRLGDKAPTVISMNVDVNKVKQQVQKMQQSVVSLNGHAASSSSSNQPSIPPGKPTKSSSGGVESGTNWAFMGDSYQYSLNDKSPDPTLKPGFRWTITRCNLPWGWFHSCETYSTYEGPANSGDLHAFEDRVNAITSIETGSVIASILGTVVTVAINALTAGGAAAAGAGAAGATAGSGGLAAIIAGLGALSPWLLGLLIIGGVVALVAIITTILVTHKQLAENFDRVKVLPQNWATPTPANGGDPNN